MSSAGDFVIKNGVLKKYKGPGGDVIIPAEITSIGEEAFSWCSSLTSVTIPEGVSSIGNRAFSECDSLTNVTIPASVTSIGVEAFSRCSKLTNVSIPLGVTAIGSFAFSGCRNLISMTIPDSVTSIGNGAFKNCSALTNVTIPSIVTYIGSEAFRGCTSLADSDGFVIVKGILFDYEGPDGDVVIPAGVTSIGDKAFWCSGLTSVKIPESVTKIGCEAFLRCRSLKSVSIPKDLISIGNGAFDDCDKLTEIVAPFVPLSVWREEGFAMLAADTFIERFGEYSDPAVVAEYVSYISSQRKKLLPGIFQKDAVELIRLLADAKKITKKNYEADYLLPAKQCNAEQCVAFLEAVFGGQSEAKPKAKANKTSKPNELWDGVHFSLDGKKLLKYAEEPGRTVYEVPEGTKEIGKEAFFMTPLEQIILPKSMTTLRNGAFTARGGKPLFVRLPAEMTKLPAEAFDGGYFGIDDQDSDWTKYYFVSTPVKELAEKLCMDSYSKGYRCMVYTGGPLDDLPPKTKKYAVLGFLFADRTGVEDMSAWRESYLSHIRNNEKTYVKLAAEDDFLFHFMLDEAILSEKGTKTLLSAAAEADQTDRTAALLAYQAQHFPKQGEADDLALSENDPELKRMAKMAARREEIAGQKGVRGIAFVATGELENFGEYDEYTNAKDVSDLKAFIEKRGGFLRSAVSSKTDYLICNDPNSDSVKSRKAKELGVPVITEEEFLRMANERE